MYIFTLNNFGVDTLEIKIERLYHRAMSSKDAYKTANNEDACQDQSVKIISASV